ERPADILRHGAVLRPADSHQLRARAALQQATALELPQCLAHRRAIDTELTRELRLRGQTLAFAQLAAQDAPGDGRGDLAVARHEQDLIECNAHAALS